MGVRDPLYASPYASPICELGFSNGPGSLRVPWFFINKCDELRQMVMLAADCINIPMLAYLKDIPYDAGHVIIHFLVTGGYQCLESQGDSVEKRNMSELRTGLRVCTIATTLKIPHLESLAGKEVMNILRQLKIMSIVQVMEESNFSLDKFSNIAEYLESRITLGTLVSLKYTPGIPSQDPPQTISNFLIGLLFRLNKEKWQEATQSQRSFEEAELRRKIDLLISGTSIGTEIFRANAAQDKSPGDEASCWLAPATRPLEKQQQGQGCGENSVMRCIKTNNTNKSDGVQDSPFTRDEAEVLDGLLQDRTLKFDRIQRSSSKFRRLHGSDGGPPRRLKLSERQISTTTGRVRLMREGNSDSSDNDEGVTLTGNAWVYGPNNCPEQPMSARSTPVPEPQPPSLSELESDQVSSEADTEMTVDQDYTSHLP
ncbi:hypothetical protein F66182_8022 [Fusarium sp. NRRL 66182]|nr:hypothetical protein F66182_8022 [Fusarium sp. NRRL 66182]